MSWVEFHLTFPFATDTESVMYLLDEAGCINSWEDRPLDIIEIPDGYDYAIKESDVTIVTYKKMTGSEPKREADQYTNELHQILKAFQPIAITWKKAELVTGEEWKEHFTIQEVSDELILVPLWERDKIDQYVQQYKLVFEPGAAFGTGNHGTTRSCLQMIEMVGVEGKSVIDIGAGSGILSVYSKMRGASHVTAVDINPSSPSEIEYLSQLNSVSDIEVVVTDGNELEGHTDYDLLILNIGGEEAVRQTDTCARLLKEEGKAIISGIVKWAEEEVVDTYIHAGFVFQDRKVDDEWTTLLFTKRLRK